MMAAVDNCGAVRTWLLS